ncbi:MAG: PDZ domain-containing protein, partial [Bacteroidota bacterium]
HASSFNSTISYYTKGALIASLLDLLILANSEGKFSLDDVMKEMYWVYYKQLDRPFEEAELKACLEKYALISLDDFFEAYIHGTKAIAYDQFLEPLGLELVAEEAKKNFPLGMEISDANISKIYRDSPAEKIGLNLGDELVSINGLKGDDWSEMIESYSEGARMSFQVIRDQNLLNLEGQKQEFLLKNLQVREMKEKSSAQINVLDKWLRKKL